MKILVLILTMLLSCSCSYRTSGDRETQELVAVAVVESGNQDDNKKNADYRPSGILPARTAVYSGEDTSVTPSVRSTNSGRRVQHSNKSPFLVIKTGKDIDRNNLHSFLTDLKRFPSGIHSTNRYIHSLCQLLI